MEWHETSSEIHAKDFVDVEPVDKWMSECHCTVTMPHVGKSLAVLSDSEHNFNNNLSHISRS